MFQIIGMGSRTTTIFTATLTAPGIHAARITSTQVPGISGLQALDTGVHWKRDKKTEAMLLARIVAPTKYRMRVNCGRQPEMRWNRRRAEILNVELPSQ